MSYLRIGDLQSIRWTIRGTSHARVMIILAPNFEERSTHCCTELIELFEGLDQDGSTSEIHWIIFTLQGRHSPTFLDAIKAVNVRRVVQALSGGQHRGRVAHKIIEYPIDPGRFLGELALLMRGLPCIDQLIVDYSAVPRNLLSALIEEVAASSSNRGRFPKVRKVALLYAWADNYPKAAGPELLGEVVGHFSSLPLRSLLEERDHAEVVIFAAGTTHDAVALLEALRGNGMGNQIGIHLVNFMNSDNLLESRLKLRNHYTILRDAPLQGVQVRYVFTVRHALAYMRDVAAICSQASDEGLRTLLAIGSFGPKPLAVAAQFVVQEHAEQHGTTSEVRADVLNSRGSQYLSPYSLGARDITVFEYHSTDPASLPPLK
ncbi:MULTISPECIES: hypothetical protein [Amycolatopsis]|uniref:Uncharacterized protein n=3 Tax=Amycolatopsis TaxID=1813 RepID=A0ABW5HT46_9PSEU